MIQGSKPKENLTSGSATPSIRSVSATAAATVRRLARRGGDSLREWATPADNPFLLRALRTETRRHKPFLTLLGIALATFAVNYLAWYLWLLAANGARPPIDPARVPAAVGGGVFGFFAIVTAASCGFGINLAARARSAFLLRQELLKSTLDGLQQLPMAEERWLWMMSAHPTGLGLLVGLAGLPVFAMAWWVGQWTALDIIGLFIVFGILGHAAPVWKPMLWQQQDLKKRTGALDLKQWQAILADAQREAKEAGDDQTIDPLERQRRVQRAMSGATGSFDNNDDSNPGRLAGGKRTNGGNSNAGGAIVAWVMVQFFMAMMAPSLLRGGPLGAQIKAYLPHDIVVLLPGFLLTWPLLAARFLTTPLPFFGFSLPSAVLLLPIWVGFSHQNFSSLAAAVSPVETFWTPARRATRDTISSALKFGLLLCALGYGWPLLVTAGQLARAIAYAPITQTWALAAMWTLAIISGTILCGRAMEVPFKALHRDELQQPEAIKCALIAMGKKMCGAIAIYFLFAWLGGMIGIDAVWASRLAPTVAIAAAFLLADFGGAVLGANLPKRLRWPWRLLRLLWFHGLALYALFRLITSAEASRPFPFESAAFVFLSPFTTLFTLFRFDLSGPAQIWWGVSLQAVIGVGALLVAASIAIGRRPANAEVAVALPSGQNLALRLIIFLLKPFQAVLILLRGMVLGTLRFFDWIARLSNGWNEAVLQRGLRYDNPVLTAELRRRLKREYWPVQWLCVWLAAAASLLIMLLLAWELSRSAEVPAQGAAWIDFSQGGIGGVLGVSWLLAWVSPNGLGQSFDKERQNGTMIFLFLTPMTDAAILLGKLWPSLVYTGGFLLGAVPILSLCGIIAFFQGSAVTLAAGALGALVVVGALLFVSCLQLLFGVRAVKPTEGSTKAALWMLAIECPAVFLIFRTAEATPPWFLSALAFIAAVHFGLAQLCWKLALWSLRKQRYGDVTATGKMAA